jgi:hypothetical protein
MQARQKYASTLTAQHELLWLWFSTGEQYLSNIKINAIS